MNAFYFTEQNTFLQGTNYCFDYNKSLVSRAKHSQSRLNSFQTVKTLFCIVLPGHLDFISFLDRTLFLAGDWPQTTIPNERACNY